tara:strand:+ start:2292 stop:2684 length:393 start_codon:yes stop_codon:yes gene_type:complete
MKTLRKIVRKLILEMAVSKDEMQKIIEMMLSDNESCKQAVELAESLGLIEGKEGKDVYVSDMPNSTRFVFICEPSFAEEFEKIAYETCPSWFDPSIEESWAKNEKTGRYEPTGKMSLDFYIPDYAGWRDR